MVQIALIDESHWWAGAAFLAGAVGTQAVSFVFTRWGKRIDVNATALAESVKATEAREKRIIESFDALVKAHESRMGVIEADRANLWARLEQCEEKHLRDVVEMARLERESALKIRGLEAQNEKHLIRISRLESRATWIDSDFPDEPSPHAA